MQRRIVLLVMLTGLMMLAAPSNSHTLAKDTLYVSFEEFLSIAKNYSATLDARRHQVELARNRVRQAENNRLLPSLNLTTGHGLIPGVKSKRDDLTSTQYYLDPKLENDWEDWAIFTQADVRGAQPVYTWGGISNLIKAAREAANASQHQFNAEEESFTLKLFELYQSALLAEELQQLVNEAVSQLDQAEKELKRLRDEGDPSLEEKDVFEFYIFKAEFEALEEEVHQTGNFIRRTWNLVLANDGMIVYLPADRFLDPVPVDMQDIHWYQENALMNRSELKGILAAQNAARHGVQAARSQYYPSMILGMSAGIGYTPNRPRQTNPFIRNNANYMSARVGIGFQQNLNFLQTRTQVQRSEIQLRQTRDLEDAAREGIFLELNDRYREARIAGSRKESTRRALSLSNEWLRTEQIDYDLGFGDIKNLVDAVKKKMEMELQLRRLTFDYNLKLARLYRSAGLPLYELAGVSSQY